MYQHCFFLVYLRMCKLLGWSRLAGRLAWWRLLVATFAPDGPLLVGIDETIERRRGATIAAKGIYRDPVRSSHSHFVKASGRRWVSSNAARPRPLGGAHLGTPF